MSGWTSSLLDIRRVGRLDPDFFDPRSVETIERLKGFGSVPLGALVRGAWRGVGPEYIDVGPVRVVKTAHVRRFELLADPAQFVGADYADKNARALIPTNSLLITSTGVGSAGRTHGHLESEELLFADNHITIVDVGDVVLTCFLAAYLQTPFGVQQLWRAARGSSRQLEIYPPDILNIEVPVMDQESVERIAADWRAARESVHEAREGGAKAEALLLGDLADIELARRTSRTWAVGLADLRSARRIDAQYADPLLERVRERLRARGGVPLSNLATGWWKGVQPSAYVEDGPVAVIKSKDVIFPGMNLEGVDRALDEDFIQARLRGGELLINMTGEGTLGRCSVVPCLPPDAFFVPSVDVVAVELDSRRVLPEYVAVFMNSRVGRALSTALQTGSSGQQHLYPAHFAQMLIPLPHADDGEPDLGTQHAVVTLADTQSRAMAVGRAAASELDGYFLGLLGMEPDLRTVPR